MDNPAYQVVSSLNNPKWRNPLRQHRVVVCAYGLDLSLVVRNELRASWMETKDGCGHISVSLIDDDDIYEICL